MIEAIGITLLNIGAVLGIVGFLWARWNNRATAPGVLMAIGLVALSIGWII